MRAERWSAPHRRAESLSLREGESVTLLDFFFDGEGFAVCGVEAHVEHEQPKVLVFRQEAFDGVRVERIDQGNGPVPDRIFLSARNMAKDEIRNVLYVPSDLPARAGEEAFFIPQERNEKY